MSRGYHRAAYFGHLEFPTDPVAVVGLLKGKSNFQAWHSTIQPILLSNPSSSELIIGSWAEPRCSTPCTADQQAAFDEDRRDWHTANTGTCRFIRATLAENVVPFVRQYNTAKTLFFNLVWLYGEDSGIDTQGGPPVPVNAHTMSAKRGRASLLAVLEAKRTLDYLPPVGVTFTLPSPTTPTSGCTVSSSSSNVNGAATRDHLKSLPSRIPEDPDAEHHLTLIRSFERTRISEPNSNSNSNSNSNPTLETIHEHEEPHPGKRIRISSGHAIGSCHSARDVLSERSISPLTLSDSTSGSDEDDYHRGYRHRQTPHSHLHLEDIGSTGITTTSHPHTHTQASSRGPKKRRASAEPDEEEGGEGEDGRRLRKASFASMLKAVRPGKARKRDTFSLSFPLRRLDANKGMGSAKGQWQGQG
ncbi:hypothetical protein PV04_01696 [Phialophora macrospora]|uniref:Uncharacterized protein n=1 Tax=Phialophora macrospora TaxID=1851006 RepID=A0A0D2EGW6_9EURO|nr:hypothetical protein PV04_01696 [Phialophora macrospora]